MTAAVPDPVQTDEPTFEWLASGGQAPSQWLLFQGPRGMAAEHLLRLDEVDIPTPTHQDVNT